MNKYQILEEVEEEFNILMKKLRSGCLNNIEDKRRKEIVKWQVNNKVLAKRVGSEWEFVYLEEVAA